MAEPTFAGAERVEAGLQRQRRRGHPHRIHEAAEPAAVPASSNMPSLVLHFLDLLFLGELL